MALTAFFHSHGLSLGRDVSPPAVTQRSERSLLNRVLDALFDARQRQAEREIARFLELRGGKFTDETDRLISERFMR